MGSESRRGRGRALYEELKARILDGTFRSGAALSSTRACAEERGLSRTTVSAVYDQLAAEGFIETRRGTSARVAAGAMSARQPPASAGRANGARRGAPGRLSAAGERIAGLGLSPAGDAPAGVIDFKYGPLAGADFPTLAWMKASRQVERVRPARLEYADPRGDLGLRTALQRYLGRARGIACDVERILVVNGSQQALDLCARVLLDPGSLAVVENPGYRMAHHAFSAAGARLHGIAVDRHGLRTDQLANVRNAALAYVTPTHQFPLGSFLAMPRRQALLAWAARTGAWVLEDDYDGEYRYAVRPEPTLHSLDAAGSVIYIGTFSKTLSPELRLGYMVVPPRLAEVMASARQLTDRHSASNAQRTLALLMNEGTYDRHIRRIRRVQEARRGALLAALKRHADGRLAVEGAASGLHVVVGIPGLPASREAQVVAAARQQGVLVYPLSPLYLPRPGRTPRRSAGLVLGYALLDAERIDRGVKGLAAAIRSLPGARVPLDFR